MIRLYDWAPSPFCLKVRAILDYKRVPYERVNALSKMIEMRRRGASGKVPALELDGRLIVDSTDIAYALEARFPSPTILPVHPRERALGHAIEEWADESLYFTGLYYQWIDAEGRRLVPKAFGRSLLGRASLLLFDRRVRAQITGQGTGRKPEPQLRADLERHLEAADALLDAPFVLGDAPTLADFALMGQVVYLKRTPIGGRAIDTHPRILAYLERMKKLRLDERERAA
jgi:glutathione S-transferase